MFLKNTCGFRDKDAREFLKFVTERFPFKIKKILTDNGKEFTNKVFGNNATNKTHEFDELCLSLGIEHRLTKVRRPQTNGMVERFNGRIADILRTHHFQSGKELEHTLLRYVDLYNNHLPQANLNCRTPCQVMYEWYEKEPLFFNKDVHNRPEGDNYAGHGVQAQGSNYLIPLQANISREIQLKRKAIDAGLVLDAMGAANNGLNIVILDACRDNPYENSFRNTTRGLARMDSPKGSLIAYATAPGDVAADGDGRNGVFTKHLLEQMQKPGVQVEQVFKQVTQAVHAETRQRQTPFTTSSLLGEFYFKPTSASASTTTPAPKPAPIPAPTIQTTPSTIDGLSLADWLLVYGENPITIANLDKIVAYERQHGGNAASRSYINRGIKVALTNVNSADSLLEYQRKFGYLPGAPEQIEARLAELLAAGASRQDLIRLRSQFPASATLRLQLSGAYHQAKLFDAAAGEYQS